jgi:hypothetical protein
MRADNVSSHDITEAQRGIERICRETADVDQLSFLLKRNKNLNINETVYVSSSEFVETIQEHHFI